MEDFSGYTNLFTNRYCVVMWKFEDGLCRIKIALIPSHLSLAYQNRFSYCHFDFTNLEIPLYLQNKKRSYGSVFLCSFYAQIWTEALSSLNAI